MTDLVTVSLITTFPILVGQLLGFLNSRKNHAETTKKIDEVSSSVNGVKDELVDVTRKAAFAEGVKAEKEKNGK